MTPYIESRKWPISWPSDPLSGSFGRKGLHSIPSGGRLEAIAMAKVTPWQMAGTSGANGLRGLSSSGVERHRIRGRPAPNAVDALQKSSDRIFLLTDKEA